jgi:hypothetical protein
MVCYLNFIRVDPNLSLSLSGKSAFEVDMREVLSKSSREASTC